MTTETPTKTPLIDDQMDTVEVSTSATDIPSTDTGEIIEEISDKLYGSVFGNTKWFDSNLGYGFVTVISKGPFYGKDIFCHHKGVRPANSKFRTLVKGEYINFDIVKGQNGDQAVNITGIYGGPLLCDNNISYAGGANSYAGRGNSHAGNGNDNLSRHEQGHGQAPLIRPPQLHNRMSHKQSESFDVNVVGIPTYTTNHQQQKFGRKQSVGTGYAENYPSMMQSKK